MAINYYCHHRHYYDDGESVLLVDELLISIFLYLAYD